VAREQGGREDDRRYVSLLPISCNHIFHFQHRSHRNNPFSLQSAIKRRKEDLAHGRTNSRPPRGNSGSWAAVLTARLSAQPDRFFVPCTIQSSAAKLERVWPLHVLHHARDLWYRNTICLRVPLFHCSTIPVFPAPCFPSVVDLPSSLCRKYEA
jgi:hypothetical protein